MLLNEKLKFSCDRGTGFTVPAAHVATKARSRGWLGSMGSAECETRDWNIQGEDTCRKGMKYWQQKPRENSGRERAERPGDGCFVPLWFVLHGLCRLLLRLSKWKASEPELLLARVRPSGSVGQQRCSLAWRLLPFYFGKATETHSAKVSKAAKLGKEKLRNTRNEVICKLEVSPLKCRGNYTFLN